MNSEWRTIAVFYSPSDLMVLESKLKDEEITYRILDQKTAEVHPLITGAIGGIRLQVHPKDYHDVAELLIDAGIRPLKNDGNTPIDYLLRWTTKTPGIQKLSTEGQLLTVLLLFVVVLTLLLLLIVTL